MWPLEEAAENRRVKMSLTQAAERDSRLGRASPAASGTRTGYEEVATAPGQLRGNSVCHIHQHIVFILPPSTQAVELELTEYTAFKECIGSQ